MYPLFCIRPNVQQSCNKISQLAFFINLQRAVSGITARYRFMKIAYWNMSNNLFVNDKNNFKCRFQLLIVNDLLSTVFTLIMLYQLNILIITFEQKSILLYLDLSKNW